MRRAHWKAPYNVSFGLWQEGAGLGNTHTNKTLSNLKSP